jgi:hypothetical protein
LHLRAVSILFQRISTFTTKTHTHSGFVGESPPSFPCSLIHSTFKNTTMVWSQEEIDSFKALRPQREGNAGKVDDFVNSAQSHLNSPMASPAAKGTPGRRFLGGTGDSSLRSPEWLGAGSPTGKKRSWKIKSVKDVVAAGPDIPDIMQE